MSGQTVQMECDCGRLLEFDRGDARPTCECGAVYAATISQLIPPEDP